MLIMSHKLELLDGIYYIIAFSIAVLFAILFYIYLLYLNYHRIRHAYKVLKSDELEIRNSPKDPLSTIILKILWCAKASCETAALAGGSVGVLVLLDEIRTNSGREPVFVGMLADLFFSPNKLTQISRENKSFLNTIKQNNNIVTDLEVEKYLAKKTYDNKIITQEEYTAWISSINKNESLVRADSKNIMSKITENENIRARFLEEKLKEDLTKKKVA